VLALVPQPTDDELAAAYSFEYYGKSNKKFFGPVASVIRAFQDARARMVARRVPVGGRVLDIGCGNGGFLCALQRRGYVVEGTERSALSAERIPQSPPIPVHVGDLLELDLPARSYDGIMLWHVLEHLRQPAESLHKVATLLRPGGWLFLAVPNAASAQARRYGVDWFHHDPPRHLFGFGPASLTSLLQGSGFVIRHTSTNSIEQNTFGEIQSALNARHVNSRDRLYNQLKGLDPLRVGLIDFARMGLLLIPAVARSTLESIRSDGASLAVEATLDRAP
jgi:SAM-dependent methyltransferase